MRGKIVYTNRGEKKYFINGQQVTRARYERMFPPQPGRLQELFQQGTRMFVEKERLNNPKYSDALCVHPSQIEEAMARDKSHGVPTDYLPDGRPIITSRAHQKALIRSLGFVNKDGGYGD